MIPSREGNVNSSGLLEFRLRTVRKDSAPHEALRRGERLRTWEAFTGPTASVSLLTTESTQPRKIAKVDRSERDYNSDDNENGTVDPEPPIPI